MAALDREQLDALRRQVEEDYRMDLAAIERLQRRFIARGGDPSSANNGTTGEVRGPVLAKPEAQADNSDDLTSTLRGMFSGYRK